MISLAPIFSEDFPQELSPNAKISILSINYSDLSHSLFSKNCIRIFDKTFQFDKIIDFAHFDNFDDKFFGLKFLLKNKKAHIKTTDFFNFFIEQSKNKNTSLAESALNLSSEQVAYIYDFISTMHKALPEYSYDFDILTNNSETHISAILNDCYRMTEKNSDKARYSFSELTKHQLRYKKIDGNFVLVSEHEKLSVEPQDLSQHFSPNKIKLIIVLIVISSLFFLVSVWQFLAHFFEKLYISSLFKSIQIFDFMILFSSGLSGILIIFMNLFSSQTLLRGNFEFFYLFPLNVVAAFSVFKPIFTKKKRIIYWSVASALSIIYVAIIWFQESKLPLINLLFVLPILIRTIYFALLTSTSKAMYAPPGIPA